MSENISVYIDGDKSGFNSKIAIDKFKMAVKKNNEISVDELKQRFIKFGYLLECTSKDDSTIKFRLFKSDFLEQVDEYNNSKRNITNSIMSTPPVNKNKELLRTKINLMKKNRSNVEYHKAKMNPDIPEEIVEEYLKLKKTSSVPIPEPGEILSKPEEYKPMVEMVLQNNIIKKLGNSNSTKSYTRYFTLLAKQLGITSDTPETTVTHNKLLKDVDTESDD
jgi:hypothetical protein